MAKGRLKDNGVHLQPHEYQTVKLLLEIGYDIELIQESTIKGMRMPDIVMASIPWEIKSPQGTSKNTIRHTIKKAVQQSENIIIDLSRYKLDEKSALKEIQHHFKLSKRIKYIKVITKSKEIIDLTKK